MWLGVLGEGACLCICEKLVYGRVGGYRTRSRDSGGHYSVNDHELMMTMLGVRGVPPRQARPSVTSVWSGHPCGWGEEGFD